MLTTEDWWAVWLGLLMVMLALLYIAGAGVDLVGWVTQPKTWIDPAKSFNVAGKSYKSIGALGGFIVTYIIFTVLTTIGAACMKWDVKKYLAGWTVLYFITMACWFLGKNAHIAAMSNQYDKYGITWSLGMGGGGAYILCLLAGLIIGNFIKPLSKFLETAAKPEWFIKTAIVYLGVKLGVKSMEASDFAFDIAISGAGATIVAYMLFWPISYMICRKGFKLTREWAACLSSGVSVCGVSAAVATGGAIRSRTVVPVMISILVVVCTIFMIVALPPIYTATLMDEPLVAGSAVGMTIKTDGGDAATGAILDDMMMARASEQDKNWEPGWILTTAVMTKIWIDMFIGIWAFLLAMLWVYKVERKPGQTHVPKSEIWFRFPKFVLGYLFILAYFSQNLLFQEKFSWISLSILLVIVFGKLGMSKGDVNDDGYIGIDDIVMAAERYGASRGDPNYEPKADVNDDGYIGIDDIVTMAELYGQNAEGKPIELQQLVNDQWIKLQETMTANGGSYSFNVQIPSDFSTPSTIYFRAYFPGGEY